MSNWGCFSLAGSGNAQAGNRRNGPTTFLGKIDWTSSDRAMRSDDKIDF